MKVAQVVTYVSPDGAFGGPVRVALGQAEALVERGHEVTVFSTAPREFAGTSHQDGYTLVTFPAVRLAPVGGFASMTSPRLIRALHSDAARFDFAHIHLARDLVTIPAAGMFRRARVPYLAQPHGMVDASRNPLARPLDKLATKPLLRDAVVVLTLTDRESSDILDLVPTARVAPISNGVRISELAPYGERDDVVLFLARLHPRKRPLAFVEMARVLRDALPATRFVLAGPDEGEGGAVRDAIARAGMGDRLEWVGAISPDQTEALLASARVYVLPSFGEVFPMTVLESLRMGTPVVATSDLGIAEACRSYGAAVITDGSPTMLAEAVLSILSSRASAENLRQGGIEYLKRELDIRRVAAEIEGHYSTDFRPAVKLSKQTRRKSSWKNAGP